MTATTTTSNREGRISIGEVDDYLRSRGVHLRSRLSFEQLLEFWRSMVRQTKGMHSTMAQEVVDRVEAAPALLAEEVDMETVTANMDLIECMLTAVIPPAQQNEAFVGAFRPFSTDLVYATQKFRDYLSGEDGAHKHVQVNMDMESVIQAKIMSAYSMILARFYGRRFEHITPFVFTAQSPADGLDLHFRSEIDPRFMDIKVDGELPQLSDDDIDALMKNSTDLEMWSRLLPLDLFVFSGVSIFAATDVSEQETLSRLKYRLIESDALTNATSFDRLERAVRNIMRRRDLRLGITPFAKDYDTMMMFAGRLGRSLILTDDCGLNCDAFKNSVYQRAYEAGGFVVETDLERLPNRRGTEELLLRAGLRNIAVAPLIHDGKVVGMIELASPNAGDLTSLNTLKLQQLLPMFAVAMKRSVDDLNAQIQQIIKNECTAIHPAVEWRFHRAAVNVLARQPRQDRAVGEMEPIVFEDVYPLYGLSDIRGSSTQRNECIRADLAGQLSLALDVVRAAAAVKPMPIFDELDFRLSRMVDSVIEHLGSGDELSILDYLRSEVEPLFQHLRTYSTRVDDIVRVYYDSLSPELNIVYRKRREFDESVARINDTVGQILEKAQERAQAMFPHYFEKYKSDGVDHGMYIGASLNSEGYFDRMYLKNLRLWQLEAMCEAAVSTDRLRDDLPLPLESAHLILVQDTPLAIRFRVDEKQFDVDGAYNIRYEIIKKRIDKAVVKGSGERLTQPGKIAIVYSQNKEAREYEEYLNYLQSVGTIEPQIESFELEDMQSVSGLRALRVTVSGTQAARSKKNGREQAGKRLRLNGRGARRSTAEVAAETGENP